MLKKIFRIFHKNDIVLHILDELQQCIPKEYLNKYIQQINYIDKFQWILEKEVDLYFSKSIPESLKIEAYKEKKIADILIIDINNKKYKIKIYFVCGYIFSLESNLPFKGLLIEEIKEISIKCESI